MPGEEGRISQPIPGAAVLAPPPVPEPAPSLEVKNEPNHCNDRGRSGGCPDHSAQSCQLLLISHTQRTAACAWRNVHTLGHAHAVQKQGPRGECIDTLAGFSYDCIS